MNKELQVIKAFYDFFTEKNPDIEAFKKMALKSLVYNGNIKLATLEDFIEKKRIDVDIKKKQKQIKKLQDEIKQLKQKSLDDEVDEIASTVTAGSGILHNDGCSIPRTTLRSGC